MQSRILIIEDEVKLAEILAKYLIQSEFTVDVVHDGADAIAAFERVKPDLILLDLMLPHVDGVTICQQIRQHSIVPIVMTTAKVEEVDRLLGLEIGADDYICKPYSPREVVARVKALLRRVAFMQLADPSAQATALQLDEHTLNAIYCGQAVSLTAVEFQLFNKLFSQPGRIYNREQLMDSIYDDARIVSDRTIDSHIKKVRKKLAMIAPHTDFIHSIYGVGYKFESIAH